MPETPLDSRQTQIQKQKWCKAIFALVPTLLWLCLCWRKAEDVSGLVSRAFRGLGDGDGCFSLIQCLVLFHFQVYLIYLLYCPHGVLRAITFPLRPSASVPDLDNKWCLPFLLGPSPTKVSPQFSFFHILTMF